MRAAVLLLALAAVLYAKVFKIETYNAGSNRARLIEFEKKISSIRKVDNFRKGLYQDYLRKMDQLRSRHEVLASGSQPFIDYYDDFYVNE